MRQRWPAPRQSIGSTLGVSSDCSHQQGRAHTHCRVTLSGRRGAYRQNLSTMAVRLAKCAEVLSKSSSMRAPRANSSRCRFHPGRVPSYSLIEIPPENASAGRAGVIAWSITSTSRARSCSASAEVRMSSATAARISRWSSRLSRSTHRGPSGSGGPDPARLSAVAGSDTVIGSQRFPRSPRPATTLRSFAARFEFDTIRLRSRTTSDVAAVSVEPDRADITRTG